MASVVDQKARQLQRAVGMSITDHSNFSPARADETGGYGIGMTAPLRKTPFCQQCDLRRVTHSGGACQATMRGGPVRVMQNRTHQIDAPHAALPDGVQRRSDGTQPKFGRETVACPGRNNREELRFTVHSRQYFGHCAVTAYGNQSVVAAGARSYGGCIVPPRGEDHGGYLGRQALHELRAEVAIAKSSSMCVDDRQPTAAHVALPRFFIAQYSPRALGVQV